MQIPVNKNEEKSNPFPPDKLEDIIAEKDAKEEVELQASPADVQIPETKEEPEPEAKSKIVYPDTYSEVEEIDAFTQEGVVQININSNEADDLAKIVDDRVTPEELSEKEQVALGINIEGGKLTQPSNGLHTDLGNRIETLTNELSYGGDSLAMRTVTAPNSAGKKVQGTLAVLAFNQLIGVDGLFQIPLYHSGFWISLSAINDTAILNLNTRLNQDYQELGRQTKGLANTAYSHVAHRIMLEFVLEHIHTCTLDVEVSDIPKYIKIQDIQNIYLLVMKYLHPNGYNVSAVCRNSSVLTEENKPLCTFTYSAKLSLYRMLHVVKASLNTAHLKILSKRTPSSVTVDEIINYQDTLPILDNKDFTIEADDGTFILELKSPSMEGYIETSAMWKEDLESMVDDAMGEDEESTREELVYKRSRESQLNMYAHYISSLRKDNGTFVNDTESIMKVIASYNSSHEVTKAILKAILTYIDEQTISLVGIVSYTCPKCNVLNNGGEHGLAKKIIPTDMLRLGFILRTQKVQDIHQNMGKVLL